MPVKPLTLHPKSKTLSLSTESDEYSLSRSSKPFNNHRSGSRQQPSKLLPPHLKLLLHQLLLVRQHRRDSDQLLEEVVQAATSNRRALHRRRHHCLFSRRGGLRARLRTQLCPRPCSSPKSRRLQEPQWHRSRYTKKRQARSEETQNPHEESSLSAPEQCSPSLGPGSCPPRPHLQGALRPTSGQRTQPR